MRQRTTVFQPRDLLDRNGMVRSTQTFEQDTCSIRLFHVELDARATIWRAMLNFMQRVIGALKLQIPVYEEVEADKGATKQALAVVVLSSVATGLGISRTSSIASLIAGALAALLGWFIWAALTYVIGTKILPEPRTQSDVGELMRTTGFASAPAMFHLLGWLPLIGRPVSFAASLWMLVAMVIAVRQALDYKSTVRAVVVCLFGFLVYVGLEEFLTRFSALY